MAPVPTARDYLITPNKMEVVHLSRMAKSGSSRALNKIASKSGLSNLKSEKELKTQNLTRLFRTFLIIRSIDIIPLDIRHAPLFSFLRQNITLN